MSPWHLAHFCLQPAVIEFLIVINIFAGFQKVQFCTDTHSLFRCDRCSGVLAGPLGALVGQLEASTGPEDSGGHASPLFRSSLQLHLDSKSNTVPGSESCLEPKVHCNWNGWLQTRIESPTLPRTSFSSSCLLQSLGCVVANKHRRPHPYPNFFF